MGIYFGLYAVFWHKFLSNGNNFRLLPLPISYITCSISISNISSYPIYVPVTSVTWTTKAYPFLHTAEPTINTCNAAVIIKHEANQAPKGEIFTFVIFGCNLKRSDYTKIHDEHQSITLQVSFVHYAQENKNQILKQ